MSLFSGNLQIPKTGTARDGLKFKGLCVSMLEVLCEALGTTAVMVLLAFINAEPGDKNDLGVRIVSGITTMVLIQFILTGYVATIGIVGTFLRGRAAWVNPIASAVLYLVHSTIFFFVVGNRIGNWGSSNLAIQLCGAFVAFVCGFLGNRLVVRWAGRL